MCVFCDLDSHVTRDCPLPSDKKHEKAVSKKLCFKCLVHHFAAKCSSKGRCTLCKGSHHSSLHSFYFTKMSESMKGACTSPSQASSVGKETSQTSTSLSAVTKGDLNLSNAPTPVLLKTAEVKVCSSGEILDANLFSMRDHSCRTSLKNLLHKLN